MHRSAEHTHRESGFLDGLPVLLGPLLILAAFTGLLALGAGLFGWFPKGMQLIAATGGGATLLVAIFTAVYLNRRMGEQAADKHAAQNAAARVSGILESAMDAIITIGQDQRVVIYNEAAEKVFQWPRAEVIGQPLDKLIPARLRAGHAAHVARFGQIGVTSRRMGDHTVLTGLRADGTEFPIEASISQLSEDGQRFFTVILRDVTERVTALNALSHSREELRAFAAAASSLREQERTRIARELHDELAQSLTALKMDVTWLRERLPEGLPEGLPDVPPDVPPKRQPGSNEALHAKLRTMSQMLDVTVAATRRISADLRPLMLDDLGLVPAAEWLVQGFRSRTGVACELNISREHFDLPEPYATAIFRILQESLTNAARHANATLVEVTLGREEGCVLLTVQDNGDGFVTADPRKPLSFGLLGLRERVYLLDGEVGIESTPETGTRIEVRIPVAEVDHSAALAAPASPAPPASAAPQSALPALKDSA